MTYADKYVSRKSDVPTEPHWAILKFSSIHIPGDERSRTNPGHGYPASDKSIVEYEVYLTEAKWFEAIERLSNSSFGYREFVALTVNPATIKRSVKVT